MTGEAPITTLGLALIVAFTTAVSTSIPLWFSSRRKTKDAEEARMARREDWARQDAIAARVAEAKTATDTVATTLTETTKETTEKLDVIHDLVNNAMTIQLQAELDSRRGERFQMEKVVALTLRAGHEISQEDHDAIEAVKGKIETLEKKIKERLKQQESIDARK